MSDRSEDARLPVGNWLQTYALSLVCAVAGGCTQSALVGLDNPVFDGSAAPAFDGSIDGPGYIDGRVHSHAVFTQVSDVYWLGGENVQGQMVIFIYRDSTTCAQVSTAGWSDALRPTDYMGITVAGVLPGTYPVIAQTPPDPGNSFVLHEIDQTPTIIGSVGQSGSVVIRSVDSGGGLMGAIDVTFATGSMAGEFAAVWCPTGSSKLR